MLPAPLAAYLEAMARGASCLPPPLLASLHGALRHLEARGALLAAARFIHFGSVPEYPAALAEVIAARLRPFYAQGGGAPPEGPLHALLWRGEGGEGGEGGAGGGASPIEGVTVVGQPLAGVLQGLLQAGSLTPAECEGLL